MLKIISAIQAIMGFYNLVKKIYEDWYNKQRLKAKKEIEESIDKSFGDKDQRAFEKAIGSVNAGQPTKHKLKTVKKRKAKSRKLKP